MAYFYRLEDWSVNPCVKEKVTLREVISECTGLEDEEIAAVTCLSIGESIDFGEFSVMCVGKTA